MALDPSAPPYFPSHLTLTDSYYSASYNIHLNQNLAQTNIYYACCTPLLPQPQPQPHPQLELWYYASPNYYETYQYHHSFPTKQLSLDDVETSPSTLPVLPPLNTTALEPDQETAAYFPLGEGPNMQVQEGKEVVAAEEKWTGGRGSSSSSCTAGGMAWRKYRGFARGAGDFSRMVVRSKCRLGQRNHSFLPLPPPEDFQFKEEDEGGWKTTVMIRNIPNKINKMALLEILDAHCYKENQKLQQAGDESSGSVSEFNFLYLPMDFRSGSNLGYAFVNFTSPAAARRLHRDLHNKSWNMFGSRKICEITYARVQGLPSLQAHFKNSVFNCESDDYLPVVFEPCRNGLGLSEQYYYVAKRYHYQKLRRA